MLITKKAQTCFDNEYTFTAVLLVVLCNVSNENVNIFTMLSKSWSGNIGKEISPSTNCVSHKWKLIVHLSWTQSQ